MGSRQRAKRLARRATGDFIWSLVSPEAASNALRSLLESSNRFTLAGTRSRLNWETGEEQERDFLLTETDVALSEIYETIVKAKQVSCTVTYQDDGTLFLRLSDRKWRVMVDRPSVRDTLQRTEKILQDGARLKLITPAVFVQLVLWPFAFLAAVLTVYVLVAAGYVYMGAGEHEVSGMAKDLGAASGSLFASLIWLWPVTLLMATAFAFLYSLGGPLRVWPSALSRITALRALYRFRVALPKFDDLPKQFVAVGFTVFGAVLTALILSMPTIVQAIF